MSDEARAILSCMIRQLGIPKYVYRRIVEGGYDACVGHYGLAEAPEGKKAVVDYFFEGMRSLTEGSESDECEQETF